MLDYEADLSSLYNQKEWYLKQPGLSPLIESWALPSKLRIKGKYLIYTCKFSNQQVEPNQAVMRRDILGGFLELADADDKAILDYASRWGILGLCKHGLPSTHRPDPTKELPLSRRPKFRPEVAGCTIKREGDWLYESLDRWRYYARKFRSIIALAVELRNARPKTEQEFRAALIALYQATRAASEGHTYNEKLLAPHFKFTPPKKSGAFPVVDASPEIPGRLEDWQIVLEGHWRGELSITSPDPVVGARGKLASVINDLLNLAGVRPQLSWAIESSFLLAGIRPAFLFPKLIVQLMLLINGSPDYAVCYSCHTPFLLRKGQSANRRAYCKACGTKAARREATKRYYHQERTNAARRKRKRLTPREVSAIQRALKKDKPGLVKELAERYGVSEWAIYKIREGKTWSKSE